MKVCFKKEKILTSISAELRSYKNAAKKTANQGLPFQV